jgi:hypothetical protein
VWKIILIRILNINRIVEIVQIKISFLSYYNLILALVKLKSLFKIWKDKRKVLHSDSYNLKDFIIVPVYRKENKTVSIIFEGNLISLNFLKIIQNSSCDIKSKQIFGDFLPTGTNMKQSFSIHEMGTRWK